MWGEFTSWLDGGGTWALAGLGLGLVGGMAVATWWHRRRPKDPLNEELLNALERALRGEATEAFNLLEREAKRAAASPAHYFALAAALRRLGMTERSLALHRGILARGKLSRAEKIRAQLGLAVDYLQLGRAEVAAELIRGLPRKVRRHPKLLAVRKKTALEAHNWKEALESASLMVRGGARGKGELAEVYARQGMEELEQGEMRAAMRAFKRALRRDDRNPRARFGLAEGYRLEGRGARARKHLVRLLKERPALTPMLLPAVRLSFELDEAKERERFVRFLRRFEEVPGARLWVALEEAELLFGAGDIEACRHLLEGLLLDYPHAFEVHEAYLNLLIDAHQDDDALRHIATFLDVAAAQDRRFKCTHCGHLSAKAFLICPKCKRFGTGIYSEALTQEGVRALPQD